jgi:Outer membrane protein beta-barrel domain
MQQFQLVVCTLIDKVMISKNKYRNYLVALILVLAYNNLISQHSFYGKQISISANYGIGKIQFYNNFTPVYIQLAGQDAVEYSSSWSIDLDKLYNINKYFDLSLGLSYLVLTEKSNNTTTPPWFKFDAKHLSQDFLHLVPKLLLKFSEEKYVINFGVRLGTINFVGDLESRESSHSLGSVHADFAFEGGASYKLYNPLSLNIKWINGLTKYNYQVAFPDESVTYFKYHSFQVGLKYVIHEPNKK